MGNKVDMDENDILELLSEDTETKVIVMYLEDIHDGRRFMEIAKKNNSKYPKTDYCIKGRENTRRSQSCDVTYWGFNGI